MFGEKHDLVHELPEHRERIQQLRTTDKHFEKLFDEYNGLDDQILRMEEGFETPSDEVLEELKKKRLFLKDQLYSMIMNAE